MSDRPAVRYFWRCLEDVLPERVAQGWESWGREHIPSLPNDTIHPLEYVGEGSPLIGKKDDQDKPQFSQLPPGVLLDVVQVLTDGAKHYGGDNWKRVPEARTRYYDAAMRHLEAWWSGESCDEKSKRPHLAHAIANLMFLRFFEKQEE